MSQPRLARDPFVLMLCTAGRGGMRAVVEGYQRDGLFAKHKIELLRTHDEGSALRRLVLFAQALVRFLLLMLSRRPACVHLHVAMRGSFWRKHLFAVVARCFGVPVIAHLHGSEMKPFFHSQGRLARRLIVWLLERDDRVLVLSSSWAVFLAEIAPRARVTVLPNYVSLPAEPQVRATALDRPLALLFLGVIGERKGAFDLLRALALARQRGARIRLALGGNGELDRARRLTAELGLDQDVDFLGWISGADKESQLRAADVYVLPSYNEGLPMSVLEAMAHGLPVVTTPVGGVSELITSGHDGVLVAPGDVPGLCEALEQLATDSALRGRLGRAARQRIEQGYSAAVVLPLLDQIYATVIAGAAPIGDMTYP